MIYLLQEALSKVSSDWFWIALWIGVFVISLVIESQTFQFVSIWFAVASIVSLILAIVKVDFYIQIIVFVVSAVALVICTRPIIKKLTNKKNDVVDVDSMVGQIVVVTKDVSKDNVGEIKGRYERFTAFTEDDDILKTGDKVKIVRVCGNRVEVKKI